MKRWTIQEVATLRQMAGEGKTSAQVGNAIGRTLNGVEGMASKYRISFRRQFYDKTYTPEELSTLKKHVAENKLFWHEIADLMGRNEHGVRTRAKRMGLNKPRKSRKGRKIHITKPPVVKPIFPSRICMRCRKTFTPSWKTNYTCRQCKRTADYQSAVAL